MEAQFEGRIVVPLFKKRYAATTNRPAQWEKPEALPREQVNLVAFQGAQELAAIQNVEGVNLVWTPMPSSKRKVAWDTQQCAVTLQVINDGAVTFITGLGVPGMPMHTKCEDGRDMYCVLPVFSSYILQLYVPDTVFVRMFTLNTNDEEARPPMSSTMIVRSGKPHSYAALLWPVGVNYRRNVSAQSMYFYMVSKQPFRTNRLKSTIENTLRAATPFFKKNVFAKHECIGRDDTYEDDEEDEEAGDEDDDEDGDREILFLGNTVMLEEGEPFVSTPAALIVQENTDTLRATAMNFEQFKAVKTTRKTLLEDATLYRPRGNSLYLRLLELYQPNKSQAVAAYKKCVENDAADAPVPLNFDNESESVRVEAEVGETNVQIKSVPSAAILDLVADQFKKEDVLYAASFEVVVNFEGEVIQMPQLVAMQQRVFCELALLADKYGMVLTSNQGTISALQCSDSTAQSNKTRMAAASQQPLLAVERKAQAAQKKAQGKVVDPDALAQKTWLEAPLLASNVQITDAVSANLEYVHQLAWRAEVITPQPRPPATMSYLFASACSLDPDRRSPLSIFDATFSNSWNIPTMVNQLQANYQSAIANGMSREQCVAAFTWAYAWLYNVIAGQLWDIDSPRPPYMSRTCRPRTYGPTLQPKQWYFGYCALARIPVWESEYVSMENYEQNTALIVMRFIARTMLDMHFEFANVLPNWASAKTLPEVLKKGLKHFLTEAA